MKALVLKELNQPMVYEEVADPVPQAGEALVRLRASALNRRDYWITVGKYARIQVPAILGSDGAGDYNGRRVVLYPSMNWGDNPAFQSKEMQIIGMPGQGTFAEYIPIPETCIFDMPEHLSYEEAAAFSLAGLTGYRALITKGLAQRGSNILITGVGGGVASIVLQFAVAIGANVFVTSGDEEKIARAVAAGARAGYSYKDKEHVARLKEESGGIDVIVDGTGGDLLTDYISICKPGANIAIYGGTIGTLGQMKVQPLFWKQISIKGTTMGTPEEYGDMLRLIEAYRIRPFISHNYPLVRGNEAMQIMAENKQFGKIVMIH